MRGEPSSACEHVWGEWVPPIQARQCLRCGDWSEGWADAHAAARLFIAMEIRRQRVPWAELAAAYERAANDPAYMAESSARNQVWDCTASDGNL